MHTADLVKGRWYWSRLYQKVRVIDPDPGPDGLVLVMTTRRTCTGKRIDPETITSTFADHDRARKAASDRDARTALLIERFNEALSANGMAGEASGHIIRHPYRGATATLPEETLQALTDLLHAQQSRRHGPTALDDLIG